MSNETSDLMSQLAGQVRRYTDQLCVVGTHFSTGVEGLVVMQSRTETSLTGSLYRPVVCLILQGAKQISIGSRVIKCRQGSSVIVSHTLPIQSRITVATPTEPYLAMILPLDVGTLRSLIDEVHDAVRLEGVASSIAVDRAGPEIVDAMHRLFALRDDARAKQVLAPLVTREIHYRLLTADHGGMLRQLLARDSSSSRISRAIGRIRDGFTEPLSISELASLANMSPSSFHEHFRAVTATSPLQYQKDLRMLEARRLLVDEQRSVSEAAFAVGYRSPAQFSRDYSEKFGHPPRDDKSRVATLA